MAEKIRQQARACEALGSPFYGFLLDAVAGDVLAEGPSAAVLTGHEEDSGPSALALRLAGTVHRLVLAGRLPELARHYPSAGGDGDAAAAFPPFLAALADHGDEIRQGLESAPQTNEVGRAAALFGALLNVVGPDPMPVRLWEIGASGGLNLRADRFRYVAADGAVWGPMSPVELDPAWDFRPADVAQSLQVIERVGGDLSPVDPTTDEGALRLASYVWPDQLDRLRRLRGAIDIAREFPARLVTAGAAELLDQLELADGVWTVVWHSVMWQYLPAAEQARVRDRLEELGASATERKPLAHIAFEPRRIGDSGEFRFVASVRIWPGDGERVLGAAPPHGVPVAWSTD